MSFNPSQCTKLRRKTWEVEIWCKHIYKSSILIKIEHYGNVVKQGPNERINLPNRGSGDMLEFLLS